MSRSALPARRSWPAGTTASGRARRPRMRETIECLRSILAGERSDYDGQHVRSHGFRLRQPVPDSTHCGRGFRTRDDAGGGPARRRGRPQSCSTPAGRRSARDRSTREAAAAGRTPPSLTVWVPVAFEPGDAARRQLAAQLAVYLAPPGYGEMFSELGFGDLVRRARAGARRVELADRVPVELLDQVCALGSPAASPPGCGPTTTPAPTLSRSCPPPPRTAAAPPRSMR